MLICPVLGGLTEGFGWRSTQWFQVIYGGVTLVLILLSLPETHRSPTSNIEVASSKTSLSRQSTRQSVAFKTRKYLRIFHRIFLEPLKIIGFLRFPAIALTVFYASVAFGSLYFLNISVEKTFSAPPYNFSVIIIGCLYIFNSTGYIVASIFGGRWVDHVRLPRSCISSRGKKYLTINRSCTAKLDALAASTRAQASFNFVQRTASAKMCGLLLS